MPRIARTNTNQEGFVLPLLFRHTLLLIGGLGAEWLWELPGRRGWPAGSPAEIGTFIGALVFFALAFGLFGYILFRWCRIVAHRGLRMRATNFWWVVLLGDPLILLLIWLGLRFNNVEVLPQNWVRDLFSSREQELLITFFLGLFYVLINAALCVQFYGLIQGLVPPPPPPTPKKSPAAPDDIQVDPGWDQAGPMPPADRPK